MADVINLRRARKAKARKGAEAKAAENRLTFGRSKMEKAVEAVRRNSEARLLDGAHLVTDAPSKPEDG